MSQSPTTGTDPRDEKRMISPLKTLSDIEDRTMFVYETEKHESRQVKRDKLQDFYKVKHATEPVFLMVPIEPYRKRVDVILPGEKGLGELLLPLADRGKRV
ncbi:hypothetical protein HJFPF1_10739 [Paramyrothecium foliicola]|nr:hypothetical protein HJFPF1_10739 [Paramyrothecium foliicola]